MKTKLFLFIIIVVSTVLYFVLINVAPPANKITNNDSPAVNSGSLLPVSPGLQHYSITSIHFSPNFTDAWIDPELVRPGMQQTMTVQITDNSPIVSVTATIKSDTLTQTYDLALTEGTPLNGKWSGSWIVNDTHEATYVTDFLAINEIGETGTAHLSWSDPSIGCDSCGINSTCTGGTLTGGADGADGGVLTISGSITIPSGQTLVFGTSMTVNASIAINSGGQIKQGYLVMTDADSDNFPANQTFQFSSTSTPSAPLRRRSVASGTSCYINDCSESSNQIYPGSAFICANSGWSACSRSCGTGTSSITYYSCSMAGTCNQIFTTGSQNCNTQCCVGGISCTVNSNCCSGQCSSGFCTTATCGNGLVETGEDCDESPCPIGSYCTTSCNCEASTSCPCSGAPPSCEGFGPAYCNLGTWCCMGQYCLPGTGCEI